MRKQFVMYYSEIVQHELDNGRNIDGIDVDLRLTAIKSLNAQWLLWACTTFFTSSKGAPIIGKGWKKAGVSGLFDGTATILPADPFSRIYSETWKFELWTWGLNLMWAYCNTVDYL